MGLLRPHCVVCSRVTWWRPRSNSAIGTGCRRAPVVWGVRAVMMGSLPIDKHVVGNVNGAPREGDAAVQRHM
jgi:hypothetical protein